MSKDTDPAALDAESNDAQRKNRRDFLKSLGRWSTIIIGGIAFGGMVTPSDSSGWLNGGGGGAWVNARGGGGGWVNRSGGGGWVNRSGGGSGGSWVNRRGY